MRSDTVNKEDIVKPKENTVPVIMGNRKSPSRSKWRGTSQNSSLIQVTRDGTAEDKPGDGHIKVCRSILNQLETKLEMWWSMSFQTRLIYAQWQKHGWNRPTMPLDRVSACWLFIHRLSPPKLQGGWRHWPNLQVKSHTILGAIRRDKNHVSSLNGS